MKLLVTGGTGFIGSHFLKAAMVAGHDVIALRRPGSVPVITLANDVRWLERDWSALGSDDLMGREVLVHFSSQGVSPAKTTFKAAFEHNVMDQLRLLSACREAGLSRAVLCGSCVEYGLEAERHEFIPPTAALVPVGPYASSKAAGAISAISFCRAARLECAYLRVSNVFGEGQSPESFWPSLRRAALSGGDFSMTAGEQVRDFVPVADVVARFLDVVVRRPLGAGVPEIHHVGSGKPETLLGFARHWWQEWGGKGALLPGALPYRPDEPMRCVPLPTL